MIDIIVLITNDNIDIIKQTLFSIAYQDNSKEVNVYLMNNNKNNSYEDIINYFSQFINIKELDCFNAVSLDQVKQYGIDNTSGKYITFIYSGDMFDGIFVINNILKNMKSLRIDILSGQAKYFNNNNYLVNNSDNNVLFGKVYNRRFLNRNNIKFIKNKITEDIGFNELCYLMSAKNKTVDFDFYLGINDIGFDIYNDYSSIKEYVINANSILVQSQNSNARKSNIGYFAFNTLVYLYYRFLQLSNKEFKSLIKYAKEIKEIYLKNEIIDDDKLNILDNHHNMAMEKLNREIWLLPKMTFNDFLKYIDESEG